jgi:hypothetical protein
MPGTVPRVGIVHVFRKFLCQEEEDDRCFSSALCVAPRSRLSKDRKSLKSAVCIRDMHMYATSVSISKESRQTE